MREDKAAQSAATGISLNLGTELSAEAAGWCGGPTADATGPGPHDGCGLGTSDALLRALTAACARRLESVTAEGESKPPPAAMHSLLQAARLTTSVCHPELQINTPAHAKHPAH